MSQFVYTGNRLNGDRLDAASKTQAAKRKEAFATWLDKFATGTEGISGFVMIAESHISIHTFPDQDYIFMDIFSCRNFDTKSAIKYLLNAFDAKKYTTNVLKRGMDFPPKIPQPEKMILTH